MEVHLGPEIEAKLSEMAKTTGRAEAELVRDMVSSCLEEVATTRSMLDRRYADIKSGRVEPIDGEEAFRRIRRGSEPGRKSAE